MGLQVAAALDQRQPEIGGADIRLQRVLFEEHPLQRLGALDPRFRRERRAAADVPEDRVGFGEVAAFARLPAAAPGRSDSWRGNPACGSRRAECRSRSRDRARSTAPAQGGPCSCCRSAASNRVCTFGFVRLVRMTDCSEDLLFGRFAVRIRRVKRSPCRPATRLNNDADAAALARPARWKRSKTSTALQPRRSLFQHAGTNQITPARVLCACAAEPCDRAPRAAR